MKLTDPQNAAQDTGREQPAGATIVRLNPAPVPVSAVVVSYRTGPRLRECLYALASDPDISELVIVDNGNSQRTIAFLDAFAARQNNVQLIRPDRNLGFGKAANRGAAAARHDLVMFVNPDAVLKRGSVAKLREAAIGRKSPFIVGGRLFNLDGSEQRGARRHHLNFWRAFGTFTGLSFLPGIPTVHRDHEPLPSGPVPMDVISGALFLVDRRGFLDNLNGFDEDYFLHVEDIDLCRRAHLAGGEVLYTPLAAALHYGSTSKVPRTFVETHKAAGMARYFKKFARTRQERTLAAIAAPVFVLLLVGRAKLLTLRARFAPWKH